MAVTRDTKLTMSSPVANDGRNMTEKDVDQLVNVAAAESSEAAISCHETAGLADIGHSSVKGYRKSVRDKNKKQREECIPKGK